MPARWTKRFLFLPLFIPRSMLPVATAKAPSLQKSPKFSNSLDIASAFIHRRISFLFERIAINGEPISEEAVVQGLEQIFSLDEKLKLNATFFELTTFLAFEYFRKSGVDVAIIETGLGGRLDAKNVIHPR